MSANDSERTDIQVVLRRVLDRHPDGVTVHQLIGALVGPGCVNSQAQMAVQEALDRGWAILGPGMKVYSPPEVSEA